jgi:acyl-CoA synthetase (AMP-forming)/AMP-acid ligase II
MTERLDAFLFDACARFSNAVALEDVQHRLSYAKLATTAKAIAESLRAEEMLADEPVLVAISNAPRDIAAFLGIWAAGGVVVPVSAGAPAAATEATRAATNARLMVSQG